MNGSRSNTPNYGGPNQGGPNQGGKSSLDQLNRTIEGLEARIHGLMGERQQARAPSNPIDEIVQRQRSLGTRDRVSAAMERRPEPQYAPQQYTASQHAERREPQRHEPQSHDQQELNWERPAPRVAAPDPALSEIAATLAALRNEVRQGLGDGLQGTMSELRNEMRGLKSAATTAAPAAGMDSVRADIAHLGQALERLESSSHTMDLRPLRSDLDELRAMIAGAAREDSMRGLEARFADAAQPAPAFDASELKEELVQLAWRIDGIKSGLGEMSAAPAVRALEEKLIAVASAVETLGRNMQSQTVLALAQQFTGLDQRLDEISRAIAASAHLPGSVLDNSALQRLETRIDDLVDHVGALPHETAGADITGRIEALAQRMEEIADEEATRKLEERIAQLSNLVERNFRESTPSSAYAGHLEDISRKIDGIGTGTSDDLIARLDLLSRKMDAIEQPAAAPLATTDTVAMSRLENRLADIAARLDESVAAPATDAGAFKNLEKQIANLSSLLSQPGTQMPAAGLPDGFGERMMAIEDYIASSDEFIVEAARQAAETVVEAYSRNGMGNQAVSATEMTALTGLAEDLRALEHYTRSSEDRTQATFEALHETLVQIAGRLNELGNGTPASRTAEHVMPSESVRETTERLKESVAMPRAMQPEYPPVDLLMEEPTPRRAPQNSKVDVLDEGELMLSDAPDAEDMVATVSAPLAAKAAPKASKSLVAGLVAKLKPAKKDAMAKDGRVTVDPTPSIDPGEVVASSEPNLLLEPGSGVPDVKKILEKVRNGQQNGRRDTGPVGGTNDVIAAARRAAQAAAAEAGAQKLTQPSSFKKGQDKQPSKSLFAGMGENRRPILLAAAAVLLVVMSYPLVSNLIGSRSEVVVPETTQERSIEAPAMDNSATMAPADTTPATTNDQSATEPATQTNAIPAQETASASMMEPPANTDGASPMMKSEDAQSQPGNMLVPSETAKTPDAMDTMPVEAKQAMAAPEIVLPAGLQPAALVDAAKKGDALALFEIGARYTDGRGVKSDLTEAAKWYELSAAKGLAPAEYRLANFYEKGTGVTRDIDKARMLYLSAADKGNASAMHNLAVLYATGVGGTPDFAQAAHWFTQAADLNVRDSQFNLAILYARGNGVTQDLEETYKWFAIAAREGDQDAAQKRDEVANALPPEQLKSAKAKLDLWKPKAMDDAANTPLVPDAWLGKSNTTASVDMKRAIRNIQAILNNNGFDAGKPDGEMGGKTVSAIKSFQKSVGLEESGRIDDVLVKELLKRNKSKG